MAKKQLKIKLLPNGEIHMETLGIKGKKCLDYLDMIKLLADVKILSQDYTNEYYEQEEQVVYNENTYNTQKNTWK